MAKSRETEKSRKANPHAQISIKMLTVCYKDQMQQHQPCTDKRPDTHVYLLVRASNDKGLEHSPPNIKNEPNLEIFKKKLRLLCIYVSVTIFLELKF